MDEIYIERRTGELTPVRAVDYESEDLLQRLLVEHPDLLAGNQMRGAEPRRWLLIGREIGVPDEVDGYDRFALDHLFVDQDGVPTLVEVKRSSDTRIRREVVGQMLDYAANGLAYWRIDRLRSLLAARLRDVQAAGRADAPSADGAPDEIADAAVGALLGDDAAVEAFWSTVEENLRSGRVRMVFVADAIPADLQRIIEFLNGQLRTAEVLGVEVKMYAGSEIKAYVPRVLGLSTPLPSPDRRDFAELYEVATDDFKICLRRLEAWAERHGLDVRTTRKGRHVYVGSTALVWSFPGWEGIQVDVWQLADIPGGAALAEQIRTACGEHFGSTSKTPNSAWLPAEALSDRWDRFETEVLDPLLDGTRGGQATAPDPP